MGAVVKPLALLLLLSSPSWSAPIAFVQATLNGTIFASGSSCAIAYDSNVTAGNFLAGITYSANVGATVSCVDSLGQTWSEAQSQVQSTDGNIMKIVYFANTVGGANTLTCTWTGGGPTFRCGVLEYSGVATTTPLDQHTSAQGAAGTADSGNVTPSQDNELVIMAASNSNGTTFTIGTGTKRVNVPDATTTRIGAGEEIQTTATARQSSWTFGSSGNWSSLIATFKPAGGAVATVPGSPFMQIRGGKMAIQGAAVTIR